MRTGHSALVTWHAGVSHCQSQSQCRCLLWPLPATSVHNSLRWGLPLFVGRPLLAPRGHGTVTLYHIV